VIGLRYGLFTPTEAGAIAVLYAIFIGVVCHRELHLNQIPTIIRDSVMTISIVMLIICAASTFGYYMVWERVPGQIATALIALTDNPLLLLLLINVMLLIIGMFIEGTAGIILLTPILVPVVTALGIDPVHFGIIMVLNLTMGGVTPPVGTLSFTASSTLNTPITETFRESVPFLICLLIVLAMVTLIPTISLFLPSLMIGV
jgi:tripartite ATP-independent transporter DctM subunit